MSNTQNGLERQLGRMEQSITDIRRDLDEIKGHNKELANKLHTINLCLTKTKTESNIKEHLVTLCIGAAGGLAGWLGIDITIGK